MMNLSPTEMERLTIFTAAELARRHRAMGIRLSHPEAVALITDEVLTAARRDLTYAEVRDLGGTILTTDDVEPGVAGMIPMLYIECLFAEGTKVMALFEPVGIGHHPQADAVVPGQIISPPDDIEMFTDLPVTTIEVVNIGDRDIQVRSHTHFFETNRALRFDRAAAWGMKIDAAAGTGIRFEPGVTKMVALVPMQGDRRILGAAGLVMGELDAPGARERSLELARTRGYLGA